LPENASILIKGKPKNGKTEYCVKLSKMLALANYKVAYNSPEQGKSMSFQEAAKRNNLQDEITGGKWMLCGKQCHRFDGWFDYLQRPNSGRVAFLDSVDRMKISEAEYVKLDERFPKKMIIMVCWNNPMSVRIEGHRVLC
jgi:hypothetical protein